MRLKTGNFLKSEKAGGKGEFFQMTVEFFAFSDVFEAGVTRV